MSRLYFLVVVDAEQDIARKRWEVAEHLAKADHQKATVLPLKLSDFTESSRAALERYLSRTES